MQKEDVRHLEKKLLAYTAAVSAVLLSASSADANTIIYDNGGSGWQNVSPLGSSGGSFLAWDRHGTVNRGGFFGVGSIRFSHQDGTKTSALLLQASNDAYIHANRLGAGVAIGSGNTVYPTHTGATLGSHSLWYFGWGQDQGGYLGFRFNEGGDNYFGWAHITTHFSDTVSLHRLGISDTAGEPVLTGYTVSGAPVPAPPAVLLLATGAAGLAALRRRKRKQSDA